MRGYLIVLCTTLVVSPRLAVAQETPVWPTLREQLEQDHVRPGSRLEAFVEANQHVELIPPEEHPGDKVGLPLWMRAFWHKWHPQVSDEGVGTSEYPPYLKTLYRIWLEYPCRADVGCLGTVQDPCNAAVSERRAGAGPEGDCVSPKYVPLSKTERTALAAAAPKLIEKWIASLDGWKEAKARGGKPCPPGIRRIDDERLTSVFPAHVFFAGHYLEHPVGLSGPPPLTSRQLFVVGPDQEVTHITDARGLEGFFKGTVEWLPPKKNKARSRDIVYGWLRLSEEFSQDGYFRFSLPNDSIAVEPIAADRGAGYLASGMAVVAPRPQSGDFGEISVVMVLSLEGEILRLLECRNVLAGARPVCQVTKLLDPDPIVRAMAENSLLVIGRAAEAYIMDQRTKASPELRKEIDRVWAKILAGESDVSQK